jgi:iron complex outermembrane receptor protein
LRHLLPACLLGLLVASPAWADPRDDARRHFGAALEAARAGDYETALERFLAAQAAYPHPATLYNIARSYQDLGRTREALDTYRLVAAADPDRAEEVAPVIAVLEAQLARDTEASAPDAPPAAPALAADADQVQRLEALAEELATIARQLTTRPADAPASAPSEPTEPSDEPAQAPPPPVASPALDEAAYERIVVSASRVGQDPLDSPSSLTVLTADDLRLMGATTLPDALRRVVGVDVMALTAGHADVSIRGFNREVNNKVLVLVDGRTTSIDFVGATFWASLPITLDEIERIEIIRGPGSAVYGANAVTGVINLITRAPGTGDHVISLVGGTPGIAGASGVAVGSRHDTAFRLSAGVEEHARWATEAELLDDRGELRPDSSVVPFVDDPAQVDTALRIARMNARLDRTLGELVVSASGGITRGSFEFTNIGALPTYGNELSHHYLRADAFWRDLHLRAFWNDHHGRTGPWLQSVGARDLNGRFDNDVVDLELESPTTFRTGEVRHLLNVGGGYRYKRIAMGYLDGGFDAPVQENHFKAFLHEQATLQRTSAMVSARIDAHPLLPIGQTLSPRLALVYRAFDRTSLRASAGTAFRAPNAIESYMRFALPTPTDGVYIEDLGNLQLDPERIQTVELGVHDESSFVHQADVAVYLNQVRGLIDLSDVQRAYAPYDPVADGISVGTTGWTNREPRYTGVGVEADLELYPTDGVDLFTNLAVQQILETDDGTTVRDGSTSAVKLNAGAAYRTPWRTDVSAMVHYVSPQTWRRRTFDPDTLQLVVVEQPIDARVLLSGRLAVRPHPDDHLELAAQVWNALALLSGTGVREHPKGQPVGGRATLSASYRF